ncbi:thioredoxin family protein [Hansschlegelia sp. KR7-227]|uniref:thioredoxin family protein n=1 Tax=Hansschlegelia sp. KR7-227 TaxID=3400914 RepID=UPI003BFB122D
MFTRRMLFAFVAAAVLAAGPARASQPFDPAAFAAAKAAGGIVVVHVAAPWCPICRAQKPILAKLAAQPRFGDPAIFEIDFDNDKPSVRSVGARLQSTLIVYKGEREVGRTVGDREEGWIEELFEKALAAPAAPR